MADGGYEILQIRETHCGSGENMCNVHFFALIKYNITDKCGGTAKHI